MSGLLFALIASFLLSTGSRHQILVAHLKQRLGPQNWLLGVGLASAGVTGGLAGWAGGRFADLLSINTAQMFVAIALLLSAAELAWPNRGKLPEEPTRSLFAVGSALFMRQITDAARFVVFAIGAAVAVPALAAIGGALGGMTAICIGYFVSGELLKLPLRKIRLTLAFVMALLGVVIGIAVRGII